MGWTRRRYGPKSWKAFCNGKETMRWWMDFFVFEAICEYFPSPDEADPVLEIGEIRELLEEHCDALTCLGYADEKLEIQRGFEHWDDATSVGVRYERAGWKIRRCEPPARPHPSRASPRRAEVDADLIFVVEGRPACRMNKVRPSVLFSLQSSALSFLSCFRTASSLASLPTRPRRCSALTAKPWRSR